MLRRLLNQCLQPLHLELVRLPRQVIPDVLPQAELYTRPEDHARLFRPWRSADMGRWFRPAVRDNTMLSPQKLYTLLHAVKLTRTVPGDFFEAGTGSGGAARLMLDVSRELGVRRRGWFLDTFEGYQKIDPAKDGSHVAVNQCRLAPKDEVAQLLQDDFAEVHIIAGLIPGTLAQVKAEQIAFAHIDVNLHEPTLTATEFCLQRLAPNGIIVFDDYNWPACYAARQAIDEVCGRFGLEVFALPDSTQAILLKR